MGPASLAEPTEGGSRVLEFARNGRLAEPLGHELASVDVAKASRIRSWQQSVAVRCSRCCRVAGTLTADEHSCETATASRRGMGNVEPGGSQGP